MNDNSEAITRSQDTGQSQYLHQHVFEPRRFRDGNEPVLLDLILILNMIFGVIHNPGLGESHHAPNA